MKHFVLPRFSSLLVGFAVVMFALVSWAQTGSIAGTVTDSTGAVVQGAQVTIKNTATNAARTATSGTTGAYSVPNLSIGMYEITVTKASFKTFRMQGVQLTVAQALTVNAKLEAGTVSEEVQVRADQVSNNERVAAHFARPLPTCIALARSGPDQCLRRRFRQWGTGTEQQFSP